MAPAHDTADIEARLGELSSAGLRRALRLIEGAQGPSVTLDGREVLLLCSNNYLGLAGDERVRAAAAEAAMRWGAGAGASRLVSGTMTIHQQLERALADFKGAQSCLLYGSGYLANVGVISALAGRGDVVFSDELNHASIVDGCRLSRARTFVYRHRDVEHLEWGMRAAGVGSYRGGGGPQGGSGLIVTDGVFSMDGDVAPVDGIVGLARRYGARVVVDEAHGTGALGPGGRGAVAEAGLSEDIDVVVGTLGKALGSYGAYVCCSRVLSDFLVNRSRSLIFSTAPPPPSAAAALAALEVVVAEPERVERLQRNAELLRAELAREGLGSGESRTQVIPLLAGDAEVAVAICEAALVRGVFAQAIMPPTVPAGTSRLRLAVMATHTEEELRHVARVLGEAAREVGLAGAGGAGVDPLARAA